MFEKRETKKFRVHSRHANFRFFKYYLCYKYPKMTVSAVFISTSLQWQTAPPPASTTQERYRTERMKRLLVIIFHRSRVSVWCNKLPSLCCEKTEVNQELCLSEINKVFEGNRTLGLTVRETRSAWQSFGRMFLTQAYRRANLNLTISIQAAAHFLDISEFITADLL